MMVGVQTEVKIVFLITSFVSVRVWTASWLSAALSRQECKEPGIEGQRGLEKIFDYPVSTASTAAESFDRTFSIFSRISRQRVR
jgi:hypothetical protein